MRVSLAIIFLVFICSTVWAESRGMILPTPKGYYGDIIDDQMKGVDTSNPSEVINAVQVPVHSLSSLRPTQPYPVNSTDRADKLSNSAAFALEGQHAAEAAWGNLMGIGWAVFTSGLPMDGTLIKAGTDIMGVGGVYDQTKKDMEAVKTQSEYGAIRLRNDPQFEVQLAHSSSSGSSSTQSSSSIRSMSQKITADMDSKTKAFFSTHGIEAEDFVARLLTGEIDGSSPYAVTSALGINAHFTFEDMKKGKELANKILSGETTATEAIRNAKKSLKDKTKNKHANTDEEEPDKKNTEISSVSHVLPGISRNPASHNGFTGYGGHTLDGNIRAKKRKTSGSIQKISASLYFWLYERGITVPLRTQNIFHIARRQYRYFNDWQKKDKAFNKFYP